MAHYSSERPLYLIQNRTWPEELYEYVRELQRNRTRIVTEADVLNGLFSRRRDDPVTAKLVREIQKSVARAVEINRRICALKTKMREEFEDAVYEPGEQVLLPFSARTMLQEKLITDY